MKGQVVTAAALALATLAMVNPAALAQPKPAQGWHDLSPQQRYHTLQNYWQHQQLPRDRQREVEQHYERWRSLSPDERARVRENYERFRKLPPQERERFERKYDKWRQQDQPRH